MTAPRPRFFAIRAAAGGAQRLARVGSLLAATVAVFVVACPPGELDAQRYGSRFSGGFSGVYGAPIGEFSDFVERGWGLNLHGVLPVDRAGVLGLRGDAGFLIYGHERQRDCLSRTVGCRIQVDVNTTNSIALAGLGPQLSLPLGPIRPYVNARAGLAYIATNSSVEGTRSDRDFADTTNFDDLVFSWGAGGGLAVSLSRGARPVALDLSVTWLDNGRASYLREGDIIDEPDGGILIDPVRSDTDLLLFQIGLSFGG
jgi:opacity protein-like surface antigen